VGLIIMFTFFINTGIIICYAMAGYSFQNYIIDQNTGWEQIVFGIIYLGFVLGFLAVERKANEIC
jgi:F0F1-type ATP synthase assembly protein I